MRKRPLTHVAALCLRHVRRFSLCTHQLASVLACLASMYASTVLGLHAAVLAIGIAVALCVTCLARGYLRHTVMLALSIRAARTFASDGYRGHNTQGALSDCPTQIAGARTALVRRCRTVRP